MQLKIIFLFLSILIVRPVISQTQEEDSLWQIKRSAMMDSMAYIKAYETIYIYQNDKIIDSIEKNTVNLNFENARVKIIEVKKDWSIVEIKKIDYYLGFIENDSSSKKPFQELNSVKIKTNYLLTTIQSLMIYKSPDMKSKKILDIPNTKEEWYHFTVQDAKITDMKLGWYKVEFNFEKKKYLGWIPMDLCCFTTMSSCE